MIFEKAINEVKEKIKRYETERIKGISERLQEESLAFMRGELQALQKCSNSVEKVLNKLDSKISTNFIQKHNACIYFTEFETAKEELKEVELK